MPMLRLTEPQLNAFQRAGVPSDVFIQFLIYGPQERTIALAVATHAQRAGLWAELLVTNRSYELKLWEPNPSLGLSERPDGEPAFVCTIDGERGDQFMGVRLACAYHKWAHTRRQR